MRSWWLLWVTLVVAWTAALLAPLSSASTMLSHHDGLKFAIGKTFHVGSYAGLTVLGSFLPLSRRGRVAMLLFLAAHAIATECLQPYFGRTGAVADVGLDWLGIALGVAVRWRFWLSRPTTDNSY